jgi:2-amino-4-hydroxy-6-hydroxymethyldihydropteridine diphosphokinase
MEENSLVVSLSLGSNLGNKEENLQKAINQIRKRIGDVYAISNFFVSEPWGFSSKNEFINCCCLVKTQLSVFDFISETQQIEREMGRMEKDGKDYEDRIIDIDIIFFDDQIIHNENLTIPHKNFRKRDFVLQPLNQLSNQLDPSTFITVGQFTK